MKQFAVIGDPIAHSLSPKLHREVYRQLEIDASFLSIHVKQNELPSFLSQHKLDGFNVTIPHKQSVIPYLDELDESAQTIGAVNCVYGNKGYNTDWTGFLDAMRSNGISLKNKDSLVIGAGGASRAIAFGLAKAGVKSILVQNRTQSKANELLEWVKTIFPNNKPNTDPDIIINCTPLGMYPDTESMPEYKIKTAHTLADTIYNPIETAWLKKGRELGATVVGGLDMFIAQGLASAGIWFGGKISEKINPEKIREALFIHL